MKSIVLLENIYIYIFFSDKVKIQYFITDIKVS